ncbi:MAG: hypothetical protein IKD68_13810, partial [Solobacterium sp.]|nr:hypothetical protein [Solobacterium sp.]
RLAIEHSREACILADSSKFNKLSPVPFASLRDAVILTDAVRDFDPSLIRYITVSGESSL